MSTNACDIVSLYNSMSNAYFASIFYTLSCIICRIGILSLYLDVLYGVHMQYTIPFYISPCPNDTFITYAMNTGKIDLNCKYQLHFADVEELNHNIVGGRPCVSKISVAALAQAKNEYTILNTGAAMGMGCGPLLVGRPQENVPSGTIAIPGIYTTANALLQLCGLYTGKRIPMLFSDIPHAVHNGVVDMGVIIHESRFEYEQYGLQLLLDLGIFWEERYALPLPLGIFVIHNSLSSYKNIVEQHMQQSIEYAYAHYNQALEYCAHYAQEIRKETLEQHIHTFVNAYTVNMGMQGKVAIKTLLDALQD